MKGKMAIIGVVAGAVVWMTAFEHSGAQIVGAAAPASKIGVVSISGVFNKSQRQVQYRNQVLSAQSRTKTELDALAKQVDAGEAELKTIKPGTDDYLKLMQSVIEKRAQLDSRQEFVKQQRSLEDKQWFETLYQDILRIVTTLAQEKGLDIVLERTEPSFPLASDELMATVSTTKVLYAGGCMDLTDEVIARLDAEVKGRN
jgi:Skp family chaperone for outer membrane proteins